ncbi:MAG TPA: bacteriohemerythrin [Ignavibacteriales bacterium]|nr:bacteriohemerythrin [Ignavibacteriales bacterium]
MAFINWTNDYNTGFSKIDSQHMKLVALINELQEAMKAGKAKDILARILKELTDYTVTHFSAEEKFMAQNKYISFLTHKKSHDEFVDKIKDFQKKVENGQSLISIDMLNFLKDWLLKHILVSDKQYVPFFTEKGFK